MSVSGAEDFFGAGRPGLLRPTILGRLTHGVGLSISPSGSPLTTLSGGRQQQQLKLATHMAEREESHVLRRTHGTAFPHLADVDQTLELLDRLVDSQARR